MRTSTSPPATIREPRRTIIRIRVSGVMRAGAKRSIGGIRQALADAEANSVQADAAEEPIEIIHAYLT